MFSTVLMYHAPAHVVSLRLQRSCRSSNVSTLLTLALSLGIRDAMINVCFGLDLQLVHGGCFARSSENVVLVPGLFLGQWLGSSLGSSPWNWSWYQRYLFLDNLVVEILISFAFVATTPCLTHCCCVPVRTRSDRRMSRM